MFRLFKKKLKRTDYIYDVDSLSSSSDDDGHTHFKCPDRVQFKSSVRGDVGCNTEGASINPKALHKSKDKSKRPRQQSIPRRTKGCTQKHSSRPTNENLNSENLIQILGKELALLQDKHGNIFNKDSLETENGNQTQRDLFCFGTESDLPALSSKVNNARLLEARSLKKP
jgi:hypothetical protein